MHKYKIKYKKYLKTALWLFLCVILVRNTSAFQVQGAGNNLRVVQSNQAKSASFQANAKLKPTAQIVESTSFYTPPSTPPVPPTPTNNGTPVVNNLSGGSDGSSPYTGTADWSKVGRSARVTAERKRKLAKAEQAQQHASAPKEIIENLTTQIVDKPEISSFDKTQDKSFDHAQDKQNFPKKISFLALNDSQVIKNPAKLSLKFTADEIIAENSDPKQCQFVQINYFTGDSWYSIAKALFIITICLTLLIFCLAFLVYRMWRAERKKKNPAVPRKAVAKKSAWKKFLKLLPVLFLIVAVTSENASAGPVTTPQQLIYEGNLLDNTGNPLTGNYSFRFSLWDNEDFEASDVIGGAINVGATDYYNWKEVQTQSLVDGKFSLKLGTVEPFFAGLFDHTNMYLQVEVKNAGDPDTSYELIDLDPNDNSIDRTIIDTIPFAFNSDKLDFHDTGYDPGDIPYIDPTTGKLPSSIIEASVANAIGGVDGNTFTLDLDGNASNTDNLVLRFGTNLGKTLAWNGALNQFEFNDNVNIAGNLEVSGEINGITIGPKDKIEVLSPRYPNSIIKRDGTDNIGSMYEETAVISAKNKNILRWNSHQTTLQDYDVIVRYTLPANFAEFSSNPLAINLKTDGTASDSKIDFVVEKEGSNTDELQGSGIGLNSNSWATVDLNLNPATSWQANDTMVLKIKMYSRNDLKSYVGDIVFKYIEN